MNSEPPSDGAPAIRKRPAHWPVRSGLVPPLAPGFGARSESVPGLEQVLTPGGAVLLAPALAAKGPAWQAVTGKTQLAASAARSPAWPGGLDLVARVAAESRASVLAGYCEAASRPGLDHSGDGEAVASRFTAWLRSIPHRRLVVLDGLRDPADLEGLWPGGASGRLIVTAGDAEAAGGRARVLPVGCFSARAARVLPRRRRHLLDRWLVRPLRRLPAHSAPHAESRPPRPPGRHPHRLTPRAARCAVPPAAAQAPRALPRGPAGDPHPTPHGAVPHAQTKAS